MIYNPDLHHRRSVRLKGYDYSQAGYYYITICVQNRLLLLGEIVNRNMALNDAGEMIQKGYFELQQKYRHIKCDEYIVMPNHIHAIIKIADHPRHTVGADLCVCPLNGISPDNDDVCPDSKNDVCPETNNDMVFPETNDNGVSPDPKMGEHAMGKHAGLPLRDTRQSSISQTMQWFKTMTTNEYIRGVNQYRWMPFHGKLWQRNYYEHIIRYEQSYLKISEYISNNPLNWLEDDYYE